jgi:tetratricopeptide (TPR) repeat protein
MAYHSDFNFVGGYDYGKDAGILHVADHHVSPGKKQWTWGCGEFGKAWDRNLTDANGPYIELMTGVFTDNQPDFTWLKPFEEKTFTQYFMPYKKIGNVKDANTEIVLGLDVADGFAKISVYSTSERAAVRVTLSKKAQTVFEKTARLSPVDILSESVPIGTACPHDLLLSVHDDKGALILSYRPAEESIEKLPEAAQRAKTPAEIPTNEELYLTGLHIEQYRHATFDPDPYYLEGLKRDPGDSRINAAYGLLLLRRGQFAQSEPYFRKAVERLCWRNTNPYSGEVHYFLGLSLLYQERCDEAFNAFYKATWVGEQQEMSFYYLSAISARRGDSAEALAFIDRSLVKNSHNIKARALRAYLLRKLGSSDLAKKMIADNLDLDPFDFVSGLEAGVSGGAALESTLSLMRGNDESFINAAIWYAEWGAYADAIRTLRLCHGQNPLLAYYEANFHAGLGDAASARDALATAAKRDPLYCFPNRLEDIGVLRRSIAESPMDGKACYYLGNLLYDRKNHAEAIELWERAVDLYPDFPTAWRNLAIGYYNKAGNREKARRAMERAYALDAKDARVFFELDQLYRKERVPRADRLKTFEAHRDIVSQRDDLSVEYVNLLNLARRHDEAFDILMKRKFHPWEGGEGKVTAQYVVSLLLKANAAAEKRDFAKAADFLRSALSFPDNLGEGKLTGTNDNDIYYFLGCALDALGKKTEAVAAWERASAGSQEPAGMMFYNDQPAHYIFYQGLALRKLGRENEARSRFNKLRDYGEKHIFDEPGIDYFAVSLPDLQLFDDDLAKRNEAHCHFLIALGLLGLGDREKALAEFDSTLRIDESHAGAILQMRLNSALHFMIC